MRLKTTNNGIDVEALHSFVAQVRREPSAGMASFGVVTKREGGTRTRAHRAFSGDWLTQSNGNTGEEHRPKDR